MSQPITWRTLMAPTVDPSRAMESASRSFNGAFTGLQDVLKTRETIDAQNAMVMQENAKNNFLDTIATRYKTPEQLAAAQASGEIDALRSALAPQARAAVRGADEQRITALRAQAMQGQEYNDKQQTIKDRPVVNKILTNLYQGKGDVATKLLSKNPQLLNGAEVQKQVADYMNTLDVRGREKTRFDWDDESQKWRVKEEEQKELLRPIAVKQANANLASTQAATAASAASAEASRYGLQQSKDAIETQRRVNTLKTALSDNVYRDGVYSDKDAPELLEMMVKNNIGHDGKERSAIIDRLTKIKEMDLTVTRDGKKIAAKVPLPLSAVKAALLSSQDQWINMKDEGWANEVEKRLKAVMQKDELTMERVAGDRLKYEELLKEQALVPPGAPAKKKK